MDMDSAYTEKSTSVALAGFFYGGFDYAVYEMYAKDTSKKRVLAFEMQSRQGNVKRGRSIYGYSVDNGTGNEHY